MAVSTHHWHILGAGAIGCLFGQQLIAGGSPVTLLLRQAPAQPTGMLSVADNGECQAVPVQLSATSGADRINLLLVTTKAQDIETALRSVLHRITDTTDIVLGANGMGFVAGVRAMLPANRIFVCTTTEGAYRIGPLHIRHAGQGLTRIGNVNGGGPPAWFESWLAAPIHCQWENDINAALWHKLALNCAINPLTALHRCSNGTLARDTTLSQQVATLCDEIAAVSRARGSKETAALVHAAVAEVIAATATNRSSMLQDIDAGRATEIDYITGYLVSEATRLGIAVPANRSLLDKVKAIDY